MIHIKYLEQAHRIRKDFKSTDYELSLLKDDLISINDDIKSTLDKLTNIQDNISDYDDQDAAKIDINKCLSEFEIQAKRANDLYIPLNEKIEKLKKEEIALYNKLIHEYSHLSENDIVSEVQNYLIKKGI